MPGAAPQPDDTSPAPTPTAPAAREPLTPTAPLPSPADRAGEPWARRDEGVDRAAAGATGAPSAAVSAADQADRAAASAPGGDKAEADDDKPGGLRNTIEWIAVAVGAVLVAFLIRAFLIQAFYIPSESMVPTLHEKDRILVNKLSYKLHDVHRGDLIVFRRPPSMPKSEAEDLIKRVIALPGETVELRGNDIYIDDRKLNEPYLPAGTITTNLGWVQGCANPATDKNRCTLPANHLLVLGDNRQHSFDGRYFGPISEDLIVGRAFVRVWPLSKLDFL